MDSPIARSRFTGARIMVILGASALFVAGGSSCADRRERATRGTGYQTAAAARKDLIVTAAATGVIEPVRVVEVKSKASGEILKLSVESGDAVKRGDLLAQLDRKDTSQGYARAEAEIEVAKSRFRITEGQLARSSQLRERQAVSSQEHETVVLEHANARAALVKAEIDLDLARERLAETTVRAPIDGVVIEKNVEEGQIISSATSQVTGGTLLMRMAALDSVQVRALVDETDIGRIDEGQEVRTRVDALPEETFTGRVLKVEPQAVTEQNVTTFPVLVRIANERGLLLPGMNCEVEIEIHRREGAIVVPNEAVRMPAEARQTASALGVEVQGLDERARDTRGAAQAEERGTAAGGERNGGRGNGRSGQRPALIADGQGNGGRRLERVVFVVEGDHLRVRPVVAGVNNWDETEIMEGLAEGEQVALMPSTQLLREQAEFRQRLQRVSGVPGLQREGGR